MPTGREIEAAADVLAQWYEVGRRAQLKARAQLALEAAERVRNEDALEEFGAGHSGVRRR